MSRVAWFDIPVGDMDRAVAFYEALTEERLIRFPVGPDKETALFPGDGDGSAGCLFLAPEDRPSHFGSRVYFEADDLEARLARAEAAGGRVLVPSTEIEGDRGFYAYFEDSEGNRVGLTTPA